MCSTELLFETAIQKKMLSRRQQLAAAKCTRKKEFCGFCFFSFNNSTVLCNALQVLLLGLTNSQSALQIRCWKFDPIRIRAST